MNKLRNKSGMTLMEMMVSILILVLLVVAMGTGMNSGMRIYEDAMFESNSASLANIVNTTLSDILRYCEISEYRGAISDNTKIPVTDNDETTATIYAITNLDYGIKDACFVYGNDGTNGILQMMNLQSGAVIDLVNAGSSANLFIDKFAITYVAQNSDGAGYFQITYQIKSSVNTQKTREVTSVVRLLNTD